MTGFGVLILVVDSCSRGFSVIELSIGLMIAFLFLSTLGYFHSSISKRFEYTHYSVLGYQFLHLARNKALAEDRDSIVIIDAENRSLVMDDRILQFPQPFRIEYSSKSKFGFTNRGTSKYPGKLSLSHHYDGHGLSMSIGVGNIYLY